MMALLTSPLLFKLAIFTQFLIIMAMDFILAVRNHGISLKFLASPFNVFLFFKRN